MKALKSYHDDRRGFTIIEVVLVLAIAGLIFLMVFIALPALQRNQRDTQRKQDLNRVITAVQQYQSNNKGKLPTSWSVGLTNNYLKVGGDKFQDPSGIDYHFVTWSVDRGVPGADDRISQSSDNVNIFVTLNAKCEGQGPISANGAAQVAVLMVLEGGGTVCVNN